MKKGALNKIFHQIYKINLIFAFFLCFILLLYLLSFLTLHPKLGKTNSIIILDNNGHESIVLLNNKEGRYIELEKVSPYLPLALISIEDERFLSHKGIDLSRLIQSFFINLFSGDFKQGGSTLTQQLSKNLYFSSDKTILRKIKEAFMAMSIETHYDKNKIMEDYLNSLYFGDGIIGIYNASNYYFNKDPQILTLKESATLAALINAPNYYSPKNNLEALTKRSELVLKKMLNMNFINEQEYQDALNEEPTYYFLKNSIDNDAIKYYKDAVIDELRRLGLLNENYLGKGLIVETTLNNKISKDLSYLLSLFKKEDSNIEASVVILKPFSNEVISVLGGFSYERSPFNRAINAKRQIGSTIKPLIYYLGLLNGMNPLSEFTSAKETFYIKNIGMYEPKNFNDVYANKKINMIEAVATSDNIYAVKTTLFLGSKT
ncbi:TPA: penicillin-binding protein, partial [bacterium]|nr:penicillin-binding protein [bacterium]